MSSRETTPTVSNGTTPFWKPLIDVAESLFPSLAEWRRESAKKLRQMAIDALSAGDQTAAVAHLKAAIDRDPDNAGYYCDLAQVHYQAEDYGQAKELYKTALKHDYVNLNALKGLGYSLHALQEYDEAIYFYLRYLHEKPHEPNVVLNLAVVLHNAGKYSEAVEYYAQAQQLDPQNALIPENRGIALYSEGKFDEAIDSLKHALEINPGSVEAHRYLAYCLNSKGDTEGALQSYMKVLELDSQSGPTHLDVGILLGQAGRHAEAAQHAGEAVRILESSNDTETLSRAYWELGWHFYKAGDWTHSIEASRNALRVKPTLFAARFNLALALLHNNQPQDAIDEYRNASADVSLASDLKLWAIDDLRSAVQVRPDLPGAAEILPMLERRYDELIEEHNVPSIAGSGAGSIGAG